MNDTMDNQQTTSEQLAWLAGIMDGEGSFIISFVQPKYYSAAVSLTNSSPEMINCVAKILDDLEVSGHIYYESLRTKKHKRCYHLTIRNNVKIEKLTTILLPYLVAKKAQAELLLRFVQSRLKYHRIVSQDKLGRLTGVKRQGYSEEEVKICEQLKRLNAFGVHDGVSETTR
jgi:hypothetical protein